MAKCVITFQVDTSNLSQLNVQTNVLMTDCNQDVDDTPNDARTFHSKVSGNTNIVWHPTSKNGTDVITISQIANNANQPNVWSTPPYPDYSLNSNDWKAQVRAGGTASVVADYTIYFNVNGTLNCYLDPKMEVNPGP